MTRRLPLRPQEMRMVVVAVGVLAFATADVLTGGPLARLDGHIRAAVNPGPHSVPAWLELVGALGDIGPAVALVAVAGLTCAQALWRLWPLALAFGNLATAEVAVLVVKAAVSRSGPASVADQTGYPGYFPSGHTTTAAVASGTVVFLAIAGWTRGARLPDAGWAGLGCGLALGSLTAIGAVLGNFHWASDGLGGLALATIVLVAGFALVRPYVPSRVPAGVRGSE
jgi:membrane-associated phospholipid phosphatase